MEKYKTLTEQDIRELVIKKKWFDRIEQGISDELDNIILNLATRIKQLAQNYENPLWQIEQQVKEYEQRVKNHLKTMGFDI